MNAEIAARAVNDAASLALFGMALYPFYMGRETGARDGLRFVALILIVANLLAMAFAATAVAGDAQALLDPAQLRAIFLDTGFGRIWLARLVLSAALVVAAWNPPPRSLLVASLAALQLGALALTGHAAARAGGLGIVAVGVHVLAIGAWLGGLVMLWRDLGAGLDPARVRRFSRVGYGIASLAPIAGLCALLLVTGSAAPDLTRTYGRLAALKLGLLMLLLSVAALNRFAALPRGDTRLLCVGIAAELSLMTALVAVGATLSTIAPES